MPQDTGPDHFLSVAEPDPFQRLSDGGPRYRETPVEPRPGLAEPFNAVTATLFIVIVMAWLWRLRGRYRQTPFVVSMLPVLLAGGIGGTLYHALRSHKAWFYLDVIPIQILGFAAAIYLAIRLGKDRGWKRLALYLLGIIAASIVLGSTLFLTLPRQNPNLRVNLSYLTLSIIIIAPLVLFLRSTAWRHSSWVLAALASFGVAWFCRLIDNTGLDHLPMGTHWLWHLFGATCTAGLFEFFTRVERDEHHRGKISPPAA